MVQLEHLSPAMIYIVFAYILFCVIFVHKITHNFSPSGVNSCLNIIVYVMILSLGTPSKSKVKGSSFHKYTPRPLYADKIYR